MSVENAKDNISRSVQSTEVRVIRSGQVSRTPSSLRVERSNSRELHSDHRVESFESNSQIATTLSDELALALGLAWTKHNPVWGLTALDRLRALQNTFIKKTLVSSDDGDRSALLAATKVVESAVQLRLRFEEALHTEQSALLASQRSPNSAFSPQPLNQ